MVQFSLSLSETQHFNSLMILEEKIFHCFHFRKSTDLKLEALGSDLNSATYCVTLVKKINLSEPQFLYHKNVDNVYIFVN